MVSEGSGGSRGVLGGSGGPLVGLRGGWGSPLSGGAPRGPPGAYAKFREVFKKFSLTDLELKMGCRSMTHIRTFLDFDKYLRNDKNGLERLFLRVRRCPRYQNDRLDE